MQERVIFDTLGRTIERQKKLQARFYETDTGRKPVREWLLEISQDDRRRIGKDIQKVEFGWPIGMPYCRALGLGLWEVRSDLTGSRIGRVIFGIVEGEMGALAWLREENTQDTAAGY